MRKIMQTEFGLGGNCQSATTATLLGLTIDQVPNFWAGCDMETPASAENGELFNKNFNEFLRNFGLTSITLGLEDGDHSEWVCAISCHMKGVPLMVGGRSPRGHMHSVIYMDGELWHDPSPQGGGVIPCQITFIVPRFIPDLPMLDLQQAFKEGYTMGQEKMTHDENQPCWKTPQEAWTNSDTLEKVTRPTCKEDEHKWMDITSIVDYHMKYTCAYCGKIKEDQDVNIIPLPDKRR